MHTVRFDSGENDDLQMTDFIGTFTGEVPRENEELVYDDVRYYVNRVIWRMTTFSSTATVYVRSA